MKDAPVTTRTSLVAALCAAALCLPVAAPAVPAAPSRASTLVAQAPSAPAPSARSGSIGGASSAKLGKPSYRKLQTTTTRTSVTVRVTKPRYQKVALQRKDSGKWRTVSSTRAPRTGTSAKVTLRVPEKSGNRWADPVM